MVKVRELEPVPSDRDAHPERNTGTDWGAVYARWRAVVAVAQGHIDRARKGHAGVGYHRRAAELIAQIAEIVDDAKVCDLVIAMALMEEFDTGRFRSDEAFNACLPHHQA